MKKNTTLSTGNIKLTKRDMKEISYFWLVSFIVILVVISFVSYIIASVLTFWVFVPAFLLSLFLAYLNYKSIIDGKEEVEKFHEIFKKEFGKMRSSLLGKYPNEHFTTEELSYLAAVKIIEIYNYDKETEEAILNKYSIRQYQTAFKKLKNLEKKEIVKTKKKPNEKVNDLEKLKYVGNTRAGGGISCPKCFGTNLTANKKGYGLGKAALGFGIVGPLGLLGGFAGNQKIRITCLNCGFYWTA